MEKLLQQHVPQLNVGVCNILVLRNSTEWVLIFDGHALLNSPQFCGKSTVLITLLVI